METGYLIEEGEERQKEVPCENYPLEKCSSNELSRNTESLTKHEQFKIWIKEIYKRHFKTEQLLKVGIFIIVVVACYLGTNNLSLSCCRIEMLVEHCSKQLNKILGKLDDHDQTEINPTELHNKSVEDHLISQQRKLESLHCKPKLEIIEIQTLIHPTDDLLDTVFQPLKLAVYKCSQTSCYCPDHKECLPDEESDLIFAVQIPGEGEEAPKKNVTRTAHNFKEHTRCSCK